jgi:transcriptional regulator with XRE-family HTH domain
MGPADRARLALLGARIRAARKRRRITAVAAAEAAGISRVTLHRIERGEPTVAMGAWLAVAGALGLTFDLLDAKAVAVAKKLPKMIKLREYPQLKRLAWQLHGVEDVPPSVALDLYERNWRHVDRAALSDGEAALIETLSRELGGGRLVV